MKIKMLESLSSNVFIDSEIGKCVCENANENVRCIQDKNGKEMN